MRVLIPLVLLILPAILLRADDTVPTSAENSSAAYIDLANGWIVLHPADKDVARVLQDYEFGIDRQTSHQGSASAFGKSLGPSTEKSAITFRQLIKSDNYRGKRIRLAAYAKVQGATTGANLWMRVDAKDGSILSFDNMYQRRIKGTVDWQEYDIVLDVPAEAVAIFFGFGLVGEGRVWADDFRLEEVGGDVPSTNFWTDSLVSEDQLNDIRQFHVEVAEKWLPAAPQTPINLGFEE